MQDGEDITRDSFEAAAAALEALLATAEFVAVDAEFTGIKLPGTVPQDHDSTQARYTKMRRVASEFSLVQLGICTFHRPPPGGAAAGSALQARPFNFFVRRAAPRGGDKVVLDCSTAEFLRGQGIDFNRWLDHSVPYRSTADAAAAAAAVRQRVAAQAEADAERRAQGRVFSPSRPAEAAFVNEAMERVAAWVARARTQHASGAPPEPLTLPECNGFLRKCLYAAIEHAHPPAAHKWLVTESLEGEGGGNKAVRLRVRPAEEAAAEPFSPAMHAEAQVAEKLSKLRESEGFLRVWRALVAAKVPVLVHNGLFDLLFLHDALIGPLPAPCTQFKAAVHAALPEVWDTKLLADQSGAYSDTALKPLYEACSAEAAADAAGDPNRPHQSPPFPSGRLFALADGFAGWGAADRSHHAAFDALMTGAAFAMLRAKGLAPTRLKNVVRLARSVHDLALDAEVDPVLACGQRDSSGAAPVALHAALGVSAPVDSAEAAVRWLRARMQAVPEICDASAVQITLVGGGRGGGGGAPGGGAVASPYWSEAALVVPQWAIAEPVRRAAADEAAAGAPTPPGPVSPRAGEGVGAAEAWQRIDPLSSRLSTSLGVWGGGGGSDGGGGSGSGTAPLSVQPYLSWRMAQEAAETAEFVASEAGREGAAPEPSVEAAAAAMVREALAEARRAEEAAAAAVESGPLAKDEEGEEEARRLEELLTAAKQVRARGEAVLNMARAAVTRAGAASACASGGGGGADSNGGGSDGSGGGGGRALREAVERAAAPAASGSSAAAEADVVMPAAAAMPPAAADGGQHASQQRAEGAQEEARRLDALRRRVGVPVAGGQGGGGGGAEASPLDKCSAILATLRKRKDADWFEEPVAADTPGYFEMIQSPMDYGTIGAAIEAGSYADAEAFATDVRLVASNAVAYSPELDNECNQAARANLAAFEALWLAAGFATDGGVGGGAAAAAAKEGGSAGEEKVPRRRAGRKASSSMSQIAASAVPRGYGNAADANHDGTTTRSETASFLATPSGVSGAAVGGAAGGAAGQGGGDSGGESMEDSDEVATTDEAEGEVGCEGEEAEEEGPPAAAALTGGEGAGMGEGASATEPESAPPSSQRPKRARSSVNRFEAAPARRDGGGDFSVGSPPPAGRGGDTGDKRPRLASRAESQGQQGGEPASGRRRGAAAARSTARKVAATDAGEAADAFDALVGSNGLKPREKAALRDFFDGSATALLAASDDELAEALRPKGRGKAGASVSAAVSVLRKHLSSVSGPPEGSEGGSAAAATAAAAPAPARRGMRIRTSLLKKE